MPPPGGGKVSPIRSEYAVTYRSGRTNIINLASLLSGRRSGVVGEFVGRPIGLLDILETSPEIFSRPSDGARKSPEKCLQGTSKNGSLFERYRAATKSSDRLPLGNLSSTSLPTALGQVGSAGWADVSLEPRSCLRKRAHAARGHPVPRLRPRFQSDTSQPPSLSTGVP